MSVEAVLGRIERILIDATNMRRDPYGAIGSLTMEYHALRAALAASPGEES